MTAASYTSDLTDIFLFQTTTGVSAYGGGGAGLGTGADFAMEGTLAVDKQITNAEKGFMYDNTSNFTIGADDHFFLWILVATPGLCDIRNNRGIHASIGDDVSNFVKFHLDGSDTLPLGGGKPHAIRFNNGSLANFRTLVGSPSTTPSWIGGGANTTATVKGANLGVDGARIGTGYDILNGTGADPEADFAGIASDDESTSEGIFQTANGGFNLQGKLRIGSASTACEFLDSNTNVFILDTRHSLTDFTEILIEHASTIVNLTNIAFITLGTNNPGRFEVLTDTATVNLPGCGFIDFGVTILGSGSTALGARWVGSDRIDLNEADISGSSILLSSVAADEGAVFDDRTTSTSTVLSEYDDCIFEQGANAHHAIRFGTGVDDDLTLTGVEFSGFSSSDDVDGSTFRFDATSGSLNLNLVGCTVDGNPASSANIGVDDAAGISVTLVINPVTVTINVADSGGNDVENARVFLETAETVGGGEIFEAGVTSITQAAGVATVTTAAAHGLETGDLIVVRGAQPDGYNKVATATVTGGSTFTYPVDSGLSSPATGTPLVSFVAIHELTTAGGVANVTRTFGNDQLFKGWARKKTGPPYLQDADLNFTVDSSNGNNINAVLQPDE